MFRGLRLRLTLLYLAAGLLLTVFVAGSAYGLVRYSFGRATDLALQHKIAFEFRQLGVSLPPELAAGETAWYASRRDLAATSVSVPNPGETDGEEGEGRPESGVGAAQAEAEEDAFDSDLAAIFVLQLDAQGQPVGTSTGGQALPAPVPAAAASAYAQGYDWRTVRLSDGTRMRLLSYRIEGSGGAAVLQAGRSLADQDRLLNMLLVGLVALGGAILSFMGAGSWWLAGRTLVPAQQAWDRQQAFVANASHELRTPLTLMRASAEVAQRGLPDGEDLRALLEDILREVDHMDRLVEDQLLLSRLDSRRLELEDQPIPLPALLAGIERQFGRVAGEAGVRMEVASAECSVRGDSTRLRQVLLILLDNALAHTPAGGVIRLEARREGNSVDVTVSDNGSGIPPEHVPHVFERYYRVEGVQARRGQGSGLGLAIAKALVEAQHGRIRLASHVGEGTRVTLTFPAAGE